MLTKRKNNFGAVYFGQKLIINVGKCKHIIFSTQKNYGYFWVLEDFELSSF